MSCMLSCYWAAASVRPGPALRGSTPHALRAGTPRCSEPALPRRAALQLAVAAVAAAETPQAATARETGRAAPDRAYGPLLQGPFDFPSPGSTRATLRKELVPGRIWSFEQVPVSQSVSHYHTPSREPMAHTMTVLPRVRVRRVRVRAGPGRQSSSCLALTLSLTLTPSLALTLSTEPHPHPGRCLPPSPSP